MYKKSKAQVISDAFCGVLMLVSILVFLFVGIFADAWHPTWIVIPASGLVCGIVSIIVSTYSNLKHAENTKAEETKVDIKEEK